MQYIAYSIIGTAVFPAHKNSNMGNKCIMPLKQRQGEKAKHYSNYAIAELLHIQHTTENGKTTLSCDKS